MADVIHMDVSGAGNVGQEYVVRVAKAAQNAAKAQGEGALQLIEGASKAAPPPGIQGQGEHINTYG
jgi:hypothetical protein